MKLKSDYDAVVIGAGPAGCLFARTAAGKGLDVLVIDKKKDLGTPVRCGEGLDVKYFKEFDLPRVPGAQPFEINGAVLYGPKKQKIVLRTGMTKGFVLERKIFDKHLAIQAIRAGAHFLPKTIVTGLIKDGGKIAGVKAIREGVELEFRAPLVISAEGMEAKIAREAGFPALASLYDTDTCYEYEMANVECEDLIEIYFGNGFAPRGYAWVFPKGKDVANVGIGVGCATGANPKEFLERFIAGDRRFDAAEPIEVKGGLISVGAPIREFVKDNFMVIGTSAHQVDPVHGGGIGLAVEAGFIAGNVAVEAVEQKNFSKEFLAKYEREWRAREDDKLEKRLKLRHVMEKLSDDDLNHVFNEINDSDVDALLRGEYKGIVAKILLKRPSLLKVVSALL